MIKQTNDNRFPRSVYGIGTEPDARATLANERTALAGIRTALALVATGLGIAALQNYFNVNDALRLAAIVLSLCGSLLAIGAVLRWEQVERALRTGQPLPAPRLLMPISIFIAVVGVIGVVATFLA